MCYLSCSLADEATICKRDSRHYKDIKEIYWTYFLWIFGYAKALYKVGTAWVHNQDNVPRLQLMKIKVKWLRIVHSHQTDSPGLTLSEFFFQGLVWTTTLSILLRFTVYERKLTTSHQLMDIQFFLRRGIVIHFYNPSPISIYSYEPTNGTHMQLSSSTCAWVGIDDDGSNSKEGSTAMNRIKLIR